MHLVKAEYQPNGFSVNFGGGYSFDTDGGYPPLKKFTLTFKGYRYYTKIVNGVEVVDHEKIRIRIIWLLWKIFICAI